MNAFCTTNYIGRKVRDLRVDHGHNQKDLAEVLSVSAQQVGKYERGVDCPSVDKLHRICVIYKVDPAFFFDIPVIEERISRPCDDESSRLVALFETLSKANRERLLRLAKRLAILD